MSTTRISNFEAHDGMADALHAFLRSIVPLIEKAPGCESCQLLRNQQNTNAFVVIETWSSIEAHQASVKDIPPAKIAEVMPMLVSPPSGTYYAT